MGEPGGTPFNAKKFHDEVLRAELCAVAFCFCSQHGSRVVDEILRQYHVTSKLKGGKVV